MKKTTTHSLDDTLELMRDLRARCEWDAAQTHESLRPYLVEEAHELGIINDIYERDGFMENMMEYAKQFCPPNKAAKAVGRIKRAVQTGWEIPMESALAVERENQQILFQSDDAKEGLAAYVEKRPAVFKAK